MYPSSSMSKLIPPFKTPQIWDQNYAWGLWIRLLTCVSSINAPSDDEIKWIYASIDQFVPTDVPARIAVYTYRNLPGEVSAGVARKYLVPQSAIDQDVAVHSVAAWKRPADHWAYATKEDIEQPVLSPMCGCRRWNCKYCCVR